MAMGKRKRVRATELWIPTTDLPLASSHPFYRRLNEVLRLGDFDTFVERACQRFYAATSGRIAHCRRTPSWSTPMSGIG